MAVPRRLPFQVTLTAILALFVAVWSAMVLFDSLWGLFAVGVAVFGLWFAKTFAERLTIVFILVVLVALSLPPVVTSHAPMHARMCRSNMADVARAIQAYHAEHGQFPPACVRDAQGRALHSWRVLILPQLGCKNLYDVYRFNEPWNSPHNSTLLGRIPEQYECRAMVRRHGGGGVTTCVAIVGPEGMWPEDRPMREADVHDGTNQTIMLGEVTPGLVIQWLEPRDLEFEKAAKGVQRTNWSGATVIDGLVAAHPWPLAEWDDPRRVAHVVTADGTVRELPQNVRAEELRGLLTATGGESVDVDAMVAKPLPKPSKAGKTTCAVLLVLSLGVMAVSVNRHRRAMAARDTSCWGQGETSCKNGMDEPSGTA